MFFFIYRVSTIGVRGGGGGGGGGLGAALLYRRPGGHFHWRPYQMLERKKRGKRVSKSGVGAESADREKGIKITEKREHGIQIAMIRV